MPRSPLGLRLRFALFFAALGLGGAVIVAGGLWFGYSRAGGVVDGYIIAGVVGALGILGLATWIGFLFDENVAKPILSLSSDLDTRARTDVTSVIDAAPARYLGALAPAAQALHASLEEARAGRPSALVRNAERLVRDKAVLEALVRGMGEGVVVVSPGGAIRLYNEVAVGLLGEIGLDRPLSGFMEFEPVRFAAQDLQAGEQKAFLSTAAGGARLLAGTVSLVQRSEEEIGHLLTFRDVTEDIRAERETDRLLAGLIETARRSATAVSTGLAGMPDSATDARLGAAMEDEARRLAEDAERAAAARDLLPARHWPIRPVRLGEVYGRLPAETFEPAPGIFVNCDAFAVHMVLSKVLEALAGCASGAITVADDVAGNEVRLSLSWEGEPFPQSSLQALLDAPLCPAYGGLTGQDLLDAHRTDIWIDGGRRIVLPLPLTDSGEVTARPDRRDFYDFTLPDGSDRSTELGALTFVVFDTETTGLDPDRDEVVQIAGVRVVGGRIVEGEVFDRLVAPGRAIPSSATEIHGITEEMVADAPGFAEVAADFAAFADGAVLVAHNAPFDVGFLKRVEAQAGLRFDHPVLCTARLSAALDPHRSDHTLDALAQRYEVVLEDHLRHTALGDARATAEAFLKMLPLVEARGAGTLEAAASFQSGS